MTKIAYAGLGNMGLAIAPHLSKWAKENDAQFGVWNRTQAKYDELRPNVAEDTQYATDLKDLADSDVVFLSVLNDAATQSVVQTLTDAGFKGIFVDQSSVQPNTSCKSPRQPNSPPQAADFQPPTARPPRRPEPSISLRPSSDAPTLPPPRSLSRLSQATRMPSRA